MPRTYSPSRCPTPAYWPEPDRRRWEQSRQGSRDLLEPQDAGAGWAPRTRLRVEQGYGRWISWQNEMGYLDAHSLPGHRVTPQRVSQYVAALKALNAPGTVLSRVEELYSALTVMAPERDWTWIRKIAFRLKRAAANARSRRVGLPSSHRLYALGLELMTEAEGSPAGTLIEQAMRYRDGLMISFLAACPLRRHNFAAIEIGRHLVKIGDAYWINFEAAEIKTRTPIEVPFPAALIPQLERYLSVYRPVLAQCNGYWKSRRASVGTVSALWLSQHGTHMAEVAVSDRFRKLTRERLGHPVTMHRFRDCAATTIAAEDPEHVRVTMNILGHTTLRTSEQHYNHAKSLQAFGRHQAQILKLRRTLALGTRRRRPAPQTAVLPSPFTKSATLTKKE